MQPPTPSHGRAPPRAHTLYRSRSVPAPDTPLMGSESTDPRAPSRPMRTISQATERSDPYPVLEQDWETVSHQDSLALEGAEFDKCVSHTPARFDTDRLCTNRDEKPLVLSLAEVVAAPPGASTHLPSRRTGSSSSEHSRPWPDPASPSKYTSASVSSSSMSPVCY
jgi:hypothetical protein